MQKAKALLCLLLSMVLCISMSSASSAAPEPALLSESAILIDGDTGQILLDKSMHEKMHPASITKIMTGLLALELGSMSDIITMSHEAVFSIGRNTSHIALDTNEQITMEQALYALSIASANDAANGIAEHIGGSMEDFTALMNARAIEAGALNTHFSNAHGLPEDDHYTTAYDMAQITMAAIKAPGFTEFFSSSRYDIPPTNKQPEIRFLRTKNAMLTGAYKYEGIIAEKTGWTSTSQHTLVTAARRNGRTLIAVVMKSSEQKDKWEDTTALLNYGFDALERITFTPEELSREGLSITDTQGAERIVSLTAEAEFSCLIPKQLTRSDIQITYTVETFPAEGHVPVTLCFQLPSSSAYSLLGEASATALLEPEEPLAQSGEDGVQGALAQNGSPLSEKPPSSGVKAVLGWIFGILGGLLGLAVLAYGVLYARYIIIQRRIRKGRQAERSARGNQR